MVGNNNVPFIGYYTICIIRLLIFQNLLQIKDIYFHLLFYEHLHMKYVLSMVLLFCLFHCVHMCMYFVFLFYLNLFLGILNLKYNKHT